MDGRPSPRRLLFVGMMGSGKTAVGREIARRTGRAFVDNDELILRDTGRTARELLELNGEPGLRAAESAALAAALRLPGATVIDVAAGAVLDPADRQAIREGGFVVWLRASVATLVERAPGAAHRPWLDRDPASWLAEQSAKREPLYREVANLVVDVDGKTPADVAVEVLAGLESA